jgi:hypothetical protein
MRRIVAGMTVLAVPLAGCGGQRQDADEPSGTFPVKVDKASFPSQQRLSQNVTMRITVRNAGTKTVPNIGVSLVDPKYGTAAEAFAEVSSDPQLASRSRPIWIVDQGPPGGDTAYSNTWALGPLAPRRTKTFRWSVTPAKAGTYQIVYRVSAGLNGKAKAVIPGGQPVTGRFKTTISSVPAPARVDDNGNVVRGG